MRSESMGALFGAPKELLTTLARLLAPGGARAVIAETLATKHRLANPHRSRWRTPNLTAALCTFTWEKHCGGVFEPPVAV